jgi:hypothetical protein
VLRYLRRPAFRSRDDSTVASAYPAGFGKTSGAPITFLSRTYQLGSFRKQNATWEYLSGGETIENWTTLTTLIDRPDARTLPDLDRLAEGIMSTYQSHCGQILLAKSRRDHCGAPWETQSCPTLGTLPRVEF